MLALISARGGSKGIPRKNVRPIAGKPLIAWTIEAALAVPEFSRVVVTTEDPEIAAAALAAGAEVPFVRPAELAADDTPGIAPVLHALGELPGHDTVVLLQPTSPLRDARDIAAVIALARATGAPAAVSVTAADTHPAWMYTLSPDAGLAPMMPGEKPPRRQDLPPAFALNGAVYLARSDWLRDRRTFVTAETVGHAMPPERSIDIDNPLDWRIAEMLLAERS